MALVGGIMDGGVYEGVGGQGYEDGDEKGGAGAEHEGEFGAKEGYG